MNTDDQNLPINTGSEQSANSTQFTIHPNILNKYASYTYTLKLQVTSTPIWNEMVQSQIYNASQWATILQSGGVGPIRASRPAFGSITAGTKTYFKRDLFINDLDFTTIVGNTQETRGTNVTSLTFKIIEPNGMTFLEELYDFCQSAEGLNESNYTQLPYMLVINFNGYDDNGTLIPNVGTKYIPLTIINIDIKVSSTAAIYDCQAIPHNEQSFTDKTGWVDHNVTLKGSTLQNYLDNLTTACKSQQQALVQNGLYEYPDTYTFKALSQTADPNDGNLTLVDLGSSLISYTDIAKKDAPMNESVTDKKVNIRALALAQNYLSYQYLDNAQPNTSIINTSNASVQFTAGGSISDWLNNLVISSEYITKQVRRYEQQINDVQKYANTLTGTTAQQEAAMTQKLAELNVPFQWFKVICDNVQYGPYDSKRNAYSRSYSYTIKPYIVDNSRSSIASSTTPKVRVLKAYNYILTGKNIDVMDFDINFQYAYINFLQFNAGTKRLGSGASTPIPNQDVQTNNSTVATATTAKPSVTPINAAQSNVGSSQSNKKLYGTGVASDDRVKASDIMSTLYSKEDLLTLELKILGDPDYIKQDEIMYQPKSSLTPYAPNSGTGATGILFDAGEIYYQMNFLIPKDYDLDTGLMDVNSINSSANFNITDFKRNMFSGLYAIISVSNQFSDGKFTQTLTSRKYDDSSSLTDAQQNTTAS